MMNNQVRFVFGIGGLNQVLLYILLITAMQKIKVYKWNDACATGQQAGFN
ncbi:hypothetical protein [Mucilaginibacter pedocola]|nr:hypothetical protein [Mucilaginibacter pedocola]